jgi:hypothetical protein
VTERFKADLTRLPAMAAVIGAAISCVWAVPAPAQNWGVQPAPPSWGLPTNPPAPPAAQSGTGQDPTRYQQALQCAAALQLATLAAPDWSRQPGVRAAVDGWLQQAFATAPDAGVSGDQVAAAVQSEMNRQAEAAATNPDGLSRRAFDCAADVVR